MTNKSITLALEIIKAKDVFDSINARLDVKLKYNTFREMVQSGRLPYPMNKFNSDGKEWHFWNVKKFCKCPIEKRVITFYEWLDHYIADDYEGVVFNNDHNSELKKSLIRNCDAIKKIINKI